MDRYGRQIPKHAHGTKNLNEYTSSTKAILQAVTSLFDEIVDEQLLIRRINISANRLIPESKAAKKVQYEQMNLFTSYDVQKKQQERKEKEQQREKNLQKAMLDIKKRYGKNAVLRGMNLEEGATARDRNGQIGGHKA